MKRKSPHHTDTPERKLALATLIAQQSSQVPVGSLKQRCEECLGKCGKLMMVSLDHFAPAGKMLLDADNQEERWIDCPTCVGRGWVVKENN